jgi:SAM-dependent methyltransferase
MKDAVNYNNYLCNIIFKESARLGTKKPKVLDFGAGIGTYADMFKERGITVDCVELDPTEAKILKSNGYKVFTSAQEIKEKYDIIYAFNVLEHIEEDSKVLGELKKHLATDGVIVIYVPAFQLLFTQLDVKVEHLRRYRLSDMKRLAVENNLKTIQLKYCDPVGFFAALAYRIIGGSGDLKPRSIRFFDRYLFPVGAATEGIFGKVLGKNALAVYKAR